MASHPHVSAGSGNRTCTSTCTDMTQHCTTTQVHAALPCHTAPTHQHVHRCSWRQSRLCAYSSAAAAPARAAGPSRDSRAASRAPGSRACGAPLPARRPGGAGPGSGLARPRRSLCRCEAVARVPEHQLHRHPEQRCERNGDEVAHQRVAQDGRRLCPQNASLFPLAVPQIGGGRRARLLLLVDPASVDAHGERRGRQARSRPEWEAVRLAVEELGGAKYF
ncbi:MAG: hypothetical protein J3K34DRAFT_403251 [Monoraphidium minutum]|nr:MAG: hypothetical protein J3K34DRAFT_403251 [Monoraphidium minutum]